MAVRRLKEIDHYERQLRERGIRLVAGVDEAGRGALAGALVAAAVVLPDGFDADGLEDSKLLTRRQRERAYERIREQAVAVGVCKAMPTRIDRAGLHRTNLALLRSALRRLEVTPEFVLTDGFPLKRLGMPCLGLRKGDVVTASIAAASIVAKVVRDGWLGDLHARYPAYELIQHKGYGVSVHRRALAEHGPSVIHRRSYGPVGALSGGAE